MKTTVLVLAFCLVMTMAFSAGTTEQTTVDKFPDRPITVIVPFAAGGGMDTTARKLASLSQQYLGVPLAIVNRTGGSGSIGVTEGSRAEADGYTVLFTDNGTVTSIPLTMAVTYTLDNFDAVSGLNINYIIIAVNSKSPYKTVADLVNAKTRIRYATVGTGSFLHMAMSTLFKTAGTDATNIPFQSTAESVAAVMGGHIEAAAAHPNLVQAGLADGSLRIIGVFSDERIPTMPEVPTLKESGYDISLGVYNLILVPKGVPANRLEILRKGFIAMLNDPEMVKDAKNRSLELYPVEGNKLMERTGLEAKTVKTVLNDMGLLKVTK